jgi:hypothetical protein
MQKIKGDTMKTILWLMVLLLLFSLSGVLLAQPASNPWWVADGGGGKSAGSGLTLAASVGQPAVSRLSGAPLAIEEGYLPGVRMLTGTLKAPITLQIAWNLVAVPLQTADMRKATLYPTASTAAFTYQPGGYAAKDTLRNCTGYWIKVPASTSYTIEGMPVARESVTVYTGWNMVGGVSVPMLASTVTGIPSVGITSQFFAYIGGVGYYSDDTLRPGAGYWVKVNANGRLVFTPPGIVPRQAPKAPAKQAVAAGKDLFSSFVLKDRGGRERKLLYSGSAAEVDMQKYELPPLPPDGELDIRYGSQRYAEKVRGGSGQTESFPIQVTGGEFPLVLNWDCSEESWSGAALEVLYAGEKPKQYALDGKGSVTIAGENFLGMRLIVKPGQAVELPKEYALYQNYPNPFNPATTIRYDLPVAGKVSLKVYDMLGQEVAVLADAYQDAGRKSVEWNASGVGSGVYFCRIVAGDYTTARKLVVLK